MVKSLPFKVVWDRIALDHFKEILLILKSKVHVRLKLSKML